MQFLYNLSTIVFRTNRHPLGPLQMDMSLLSLLFQIFFSPDLVTLIRLKMNFSMDSYTRGMGVLFQLMSLFQTIAKQLPHGDFYSQNNCCGGKHHKTVSKLVNFSLQSRAPLWRHFLAFQPTLYLSICSLCYKHFRGMLGNKIHARKAKRRDGHFYIWD